MSRKPVEKLFDEFVAAKTQEELLDVFAEIKNKIPTHPTGKSIVFYHQLKKAITSWRAQSIWNILDERVTQSEYGNNNIADGRRLLVIGAGPVGLRMAVECALLGSEAHIIEKRTSATRNNVLHLWPFTIEDLRRLGAKKFYGQFCAGAIDHISIRQLQLILLKVSLLLGVRVHVGVEFLGVEEPPTNGKGWGISVAPHPGALPRWGWHGMVQASGRNHVLPLFQHKPECRGQQAIGMTVNFVNRGTMEELTIAEISGIAFIYNQEFFNDLQTELGIGLENIVYYKDETHYFVMSPKKHSLLKKGVLRKDYPTTSELLSPDNIDMEQAQQFAREVAAFATNLPVLEFKRNHTGKADIAVFDFSAIKIAANSTMVVERKGEKLVMCLVGDSLLEPFWPQGTGCARGFLSVLNSAWMFKRYFEGVQVYDVLRERESLFNLLPQSTSMKLNPKYSKYTIDPNTRYNYWTVSAQQFQVFHLYNREDGPLHPKQPNSSDGKSKRRGRMDRRKTVQVTVRPTQQQQQQQQTPTTPSSTPPSSLDHGKLLNWARESTCGYGGVRVSNLTTSWRNGLAFAALLHRHRPDKMNFTAVSKCEQVLERVFSLTEREFGITAPFTPRELSAASIPDRQKVVQYLTALHAHFTSKESQSLQISRDLCYFCTRHITPNQLTSSHGHKFHASCLKCEYCLDKVSVANAHYVPAPPSSAPTGGGATPGAGFYCNYHYRELFNSSGGGGMVTAQAVSPENGFVTPVMRAEEESEELKLRRARSVSSVRSLRDLFETISTAPPDTTSSSRPSSPSLDLITSEVIPPPSPPAPMERSTSFHGVMLPPRPKQRKSGVARKIERKKDQEGKGKKEESGKKGGKFGKLFGKKSKTPSSGGGGVSSLVLQNTEHPPLPDEPAVIQPSDSVEHEPAGKGRLFSKYSSLPGRETETASIQAAAPALPPRDTPVTLPSRPTSAPASGRKLPPQPAMDTPRRPPVVDSPRRGSDDVLFTPEESFIRGCAVRRTAPALLRSPERALTPTPREAVLLQTKSPQSRTLLRHSLRRTSRVVESGVIGRAVCSPKMRRAQRVTVDVVRAREEMPVEGGRVELLPSPRVDRIQQAFYSPPPQRSQRIRVRAEEAEEERGKSLGWNEKEATNHQDNPITESKPVPTVPEPTTPVSTVPEPSNPTAQPVLDGEEDAVPPARPPLPDEISALAATPSLCSLSSSSTISVSSVISALPVSVDSLPTEVQGRTEIGNVSSIREEQMGRKDIENVSVTKDQIGRKDIENVSSTIKEEQPRLRKASSSSTDQSKRGSFSSLASEKRLSRSSSESVRLSPIRAKTPSGSSDNCRVSSETRLRGPIGSRLSRNSSESPTAAGEKKRSFSYARSQSETSTPKRTIKAPGTRPPWTTSMSSPSRKVVVKEPTPGAKESTPGAKESTPGAKESTAGAKESTPGAKESAKESTLEVQDVRTPVRIEDPVKKASSPEKISPSTSSSKTPAGANGPPPPKPARRLSRGSLSSEPSRKPDYARKPTTVPVASSTPNTKPATTKPDQTPPKDASPSRRIPTRTYGRSSSTSGPGEIRTPTSTTTPRTPTSTTTPRTPTSTTTPRTPLRQNSLPSTGSRRNSPRITGSTAVTPPSRAQRIARFSRPEDPAVDKILAKYRKSSATKENVREWGSEKVRREPDTPALEQRTATPGGGGRPENKRSSRVRVMTQLSNSFDRTIDRLVSKYKRPSASSEAAETPVEAAPVQQQQQRAGGLPIDASLLRYDRNSSLRGSTTSSSVSARDHARDHAPAADAHARAVTRGSAPAPRTREEKKKAGEVQDEIAYVEPYRDEGGKEMKQWGKREYNSYLRSLYYEYSSPHSDRIGQTIRVLQQKQTDV